MYELAYFFYDASLCCNKYLFFSFFLWTIVINGLWFSCWVEEIKNIPFQRISVTEVKVIRNCHGEKLVVFKIYLKISTKWFNLLSTKYSLNSKNNCWFVLYLIWWFYLKVSYLSILNNVCLFFNKQTFNWLIYGSSFQFLSILNPGYQYEMVINKMKGA